MFTIMLFIYHASPGNMGTDVLSAKPLVVLVPTNTVGINPILSNLQGLGT
jgi:hypothetical protein